MTQATGGGTSNPEGQRRATVAQGVPSGARFDALRPVAERPGEIVKFSLRVLRELPRAIRLYPSEVITQAGLLVRANMPVIMAMGLFYAVILSLNVHFVFAKLGIGSYLGGAFSLADVRGIGQIVFGWMFAAKVGCGIVAELGAMRISEEIDAMEVMGINSESYLVGTRILAALFVAPFMWVTFLLVMFVTHFPLNTDLLHSTSDGGYWTYLFLFQNTFDLVGSTIWVTIMVLQIMLVACYYGFTARGGPVGVGQNTAKSMLVNLVLISLLAMGFVQLLYGNAPNAPIGN